MNRHNKDENGSEQLEAINPGQQWRPTLPMDQDQPPQPPLTFFQLIHVLMWHIQRRGEIGGLYTIFRVLIGDHL